MRRFLEDFALVAFMVVALLIVPPHIQQQIAPDVAPAQAKEGPSPAPIWSKRCEALGRTMVAHQADGGPWVVHCVPPAKKS